MKSRPCVGIFFDMKKVILAKSVGLYINLLSYISPEKASVLAYRYFSQPREGRLERDRMPAILQEAEMTTFSLRDDLECHAYVWRGNENVILLVHGWESNASRWERLLPFLRSNGSTIVAIDGPAHGLSGGAEFNLIDYAAAIDKAVKYFNPNCLIGHSIGGAACIFYQYKYNNTALKKMVLLGAPSDLRTLVSNYVSMLSLNSRMVKLLENYFIQRFSVKIDEFSARVFGGRINVKGIVAHDEEDTVVSFDEARKIASSWKHATFIPTRGLGHSMHDDNLYRKLTEFVCTE